MKDDVKRASPQTAVVHQLLRPEPLRDLIHRLAANSANVGWSKHALDRMAERGITDKMAIEVLRHGMVRGPVEGGANPGEWKAKMVFPTRGRRDVGVVVVVVKNARLFVKTAEWEDLS